MTTTKTETPEAPPLSVDGARGLCEKVDEIDRALEMGADTRALGLLLDLGVPRTHDGRFTRLGLALERLEESFYEEDEATCPQCGEACVYCHEDDDPRDRIKDVQTFALAELGRAERALYRPLKEVPA